MGYKYSDAAFEIVATELSVTVDGEARTLPYSKIDHAVLLVLCFRANNETGECFCGFGDIARHAHISRDAVMDGVEALEALGFISVHRRGKGCNVYTVSLERLVAAAGDKAAKTIVAKRTKAPSKRLAEKLKGVTRRVTLPIPEDDNVCVFCCKNPCLCKGYPRPLSSNHDMEDEEDELL